MRTNGMLDEMFEPNERDPRLMSRPVGQKRQEDMDSGTTWDDVSLSAFLDSEECKSKATDLVWTNN